MMKKYLFLLLLGFISINMVGQSPTADTQTQFCGDTALPPFPSTTNGQSAGPNEAASYGCLFTYPNPAWFYTQIDQSGSITFTISQETLGGQGIDVDFIAWGPFVGPPPIYGPAYLNPSTQVGCSYSPISVETFTIPNAISGQYYVVLLTNYSQQPGLITFEQTGGTGTTNCFGCEFDPIEDFTICNGESVLITPVLTSTITTYNPANTTYQWSIGGDANGVGSTNIPGATNLSLNVSSPGTYTITAHNTVCGQTGVKETFVVTGQQPFPTTNPRNIIACTSGAPPYAFNLTQNDAVILNTQDPARYTISYYESSAAANAGTPAIATPAAYSANGFGDVVYVRVQDEVTGCHIVRSFTLTGEPAPIAYPPLLVLQACDDDRNGTETFNIASQEGDVLNGQDPSNLVITYHTTQADADANVRPIATPAAYTTEGGIVYIRLTTFGRPDCYSTTVLPVIVTEKPLIIPPANAFICSDEVYTLPVLPVGDYFTTPGNTGTRLAAGDTVSTDQTIYIYAETETTPNNCTDQSSFTVTVIPVPVPDSFAPVTWCADNGGYVLPTLTADNHYYTGSGATGTELFPGDVLTLSRDIYIYMESGTAATKICSAENIFRITVVYPPDGFPTTPLETCDDFTADGIEIFDLAPAGLEAIGTQTDVTVTYHLTAADAQAGSNAIADPSAFSSNTQTIYIRIVETASVGTATNCPTVVPLSIIVHPNPITGALSNFEVCDYNNSPDGVEQIDLTQWASQATTDPTDTVTYYLSNTDAQLDQNRITSPETFTNTASPNEVRIWLRVTSQFGCVGVGSFLFKVNPLPVVNPTEDTFYACETTLGGGVGEFEFSEISPVITMGAASIAVTYYETQAQADLGGTDNLTASPYVSATTTIFARLQNTRTDCFIVTPVNLEVQGPPAVTPLQPLYECDPNNDNVTIFNLQPTLDAIAAALGSVTVTIHETPEDAEHFGGSNPILNTTSYSNNVAFTTNGVQILYIRVQSSLTECYSVVPLTIIVNPVPEATEPADIYAVCDNGDTDTDGIAIFDLTTYEPIVLNTMDPAQFLVSYFHTHDDAVNNQAPITNPAAYTSAASDEIIYIKVTNSATGCYDIVELHILVNPLPVAVHPTTMELCDVTTPGGAPDEAEVFDLTSKIGEITAGADGVDVTFYFTTLQDAQAGLATGLITNPEAYTNTSATESIFVRVTNRETGCYRVVLMDIKVNPLPTLSTLTPDQLVLCDTDGNGYTSVNLTELIPDLINNGQDIVVNFYESQLDAINGVRPIQNTDDYININPLNYTIYVVAENTVTGCKSEPIALVFTVNPAPIAFDLGPIELCDDEDLNGQDNSMVFDLTIQNPFILATPGISPNVIIEYYATEAAAQAGMPMITRPEVYTGTGGDLVWVRVESPVSECYSIASFELIINAPVKLTEPTQLVRCDETLPNDMRTEFDLTIKDAEILAPDGLGQDNIVQYYESQTDLDNNNPIANPEAYTNPVGENPKTLFVKVTTTKGCESFTFLTVRVLPLPQPNITPDDLELCDDNNPGDLEEEFDLTDAESNILANASNMVVTYYSTSRADAEAGGTTGLITDPEHYVSGNATVYVRVSAAGSEPNDPSCAQVVALNLVVNPLPATTAPTYGICQTNFTGYATFDLGNYRNTILGPNAVQTDYIVRYYAQDPTVVAPGAGNPTLSFTFTNTVYQQQTIYVYAENLITHCKVTLPLILSVEPQTIANPVGDDILRECDYDGVNDGITEIDLTEATPIIIGTQGPAANYTVTYYLSELEARADQNAIVNPATFVTGTREIWAMVKDTTYTYGCPAYIKINVTIDLLPVPVLSSDSNTSCVDFRTGDVIKAVVINSNITEAGSTFQWFKDGVAIPDATDATYSAVETGLYTVTVYGPAPGNCESDPAAGWQVTRSGPASLIDDGYVVSNAFADDQTITILVEGFGDYEYSMYADGPWQNSNVFTNVTVGYHDIYVRDKTNGSDNCGFIVINDVSTIDYPKYFTPNGDGYNDYWNIIGLANFPSSRIYIFDRYGKLIKQLSPTSNPAESEGWDGTFNGAPLPSDDYWFTVTFPEGDKVREFKSHFAMKR